ncbi:general substrate transporter [Gigaspora rosea]|uniref:General substrate transporter n=1 Tax=Gigaspora rosea TaxID=44941 RepID=A0A397ULH2_9GLOM|nr:general substrate transporter [Gigaspora rosea]
MFSHKTDLRSYDRSLNRDSIDSSQQSQQSPDSKSASFPSYCLFVVFVAVIASFENGWNLGVTNIPEQTIRNCTSEQPRVKSKFPDCLPMNNLLWSSWGLLAGHFQTLYGRRNTLLFNIMTWIFGGLLLGIALHPLMFVAGRILAGIGSGIGSVSVPTYIGEIATIKSRGAIGTIYQLFLVIGILITQLLGLVLSFVPGWRILLALTAIPALIQLILLPLCVESPRYLISQNRFSEAKDALQKLRNGYNIENEFQEIVGGQTTQPNGNRVENDINGNSSVGMSSAAEGAEIEFTTSTIQNTRGFIQILKDIHCRKMLLICFGLNMVQQLCGINGIILYSTAIFLQTFGRGAKYATLGVGIVNLSMTLISAYLVDKKGRKPLLFISFTGMCISSILVVIGSLYHHIVLVIVAVLLFISSFAIGIGPIAFLIVPEILPTHCVSSGGSICLGINWLCNFLIILIFPVLQQSLGEYTFIIFAVIQEFQQFLL